MRARGETKGNPASISLWLVSEWATPVTPEPAFCETSMFRCGKKAVSGRDAIGGKEFRSVVGWPVQPSDTLTGIYRMLVQTVTCKTEEGRTFPRKMMLVQLSLISTYS